MTRNSVLAWQLVIVRLQADREAAQRSLKAAQERGDTRGEHLAARRVKDINHRLMKAEAGR